MYRRHRVMAMASDPQATQIAQPRPNGEAASVNRGSVSDQLLLRRSLKFPSVPELLGALVFRGNSDLACDFEVFAGGDDENASWAS